MAEAELQRRLSFSVLAIARRAGAQSAARPLQPVVPEQLHGMRRADGAVAAREVVGGTVLVATPANALGIRGVHHDSFHVATPPRYVDRRLRRRTVHVGL